MQVRQDVLLLLDAHGPEALGAFGGFGRGGVGVAFVGVGFGDAQGEEGKREELEDFGGREGGG